MSLTRLNLSGRHVTRNAGVLAVLLCSSFVDTALALDQPITGKKLWLKSSKFVLLSGHDAIDTGGSDPECASGGSSLTMSNGVDSATFLLPCENWTVNGSGTFKYRNASAPGGASAIKVVRIKDGHLKVIGKGLEGLPVPNGDATIDVVLDLDGITHRFCMSFSGSGDGSRFKAEVAPAGNCPSAAACDATTGGFCWFLGDTDASCDQACAIAGRAYDSATETFAGSGGSDADCGAVLDALGVPAGPVDPSSSCFAGVGCIHAAPAARARCASPATNSYSSGHVRRACACQ